MVEVAAVAVVAAVRLLTSWREEGNAIRTKCFRQLPSGGGGEVETNHQFLTASRGTPGEAPPEPDDLASFWGGQAFSAQRRRIGQACPARHTSCRAVLWGGGHTRIEPTQVEREW